MTSFNAVTLHGDMFHGRKIYICHLFMSSFSAALMLTCTRIFYIDPLFDADGFFDLRAKCRLPRDVARWRTAWKPFEWNTAIHFAAISTRFITIWLASASAPIRHSWKTPFECTVKWNVSSLPGSGIVARYSMHQCHNTMLICRDLRWPSCLARKLVHWS